MLLYNTIFILSRELKEEMMARCNHCGGYLIYEPEFMENPAQYKCIACGWTLSDPNFRKESPTLFPSDRTDKQIGWQKSYPGYDLYDPKSAACQLGITVSHFRAMVKGDPAAPVTMGRGMIACNTPELQTWWDGRNHYG